MNLAEYKRKKYKEGMNSLTHKEWFGMTIGRAFSAYNLEDPSEYKEYKRIKSSLYKRYTGGMDDLCLLPAGFHYVNVLGQEHDHVFRTIDSCTAGRFAYNPITGKVGFADEKDALMFALGVN